MDLKPTGAVCESPSLLDFLIPEATPGADVATGGFDSFLSEPSRGREPAKVREFGQVATPRILAEAMAAWVMSARPAEVLDPALGLGNLLTACRAQGEDAALEGIEIDPAVVAQARRTAPTGTALVAADYLRLRVRPRAGIIANPPYIKAARLGLSASDWIFFEGLLGCSLDRLTNAYALFLLKIWHDLAPGGRAAVLIPAEFLNANYGVAIKAQLLRRLRPAAILVLDPAVNAFSTALTTSLIVLLEKSARPAAKMPAFVIRSLEDLRPMIDSIDSTGAPLANLDLATLPPEEKWLNRILGLHEDHAALTGRVGDYFRCSRGIATGANEYFTLSSAELAERQLSPADFLPCISKAQDATGYVFDCEALSRLQASGRRSWLLAPAQPDEPAMRRYLAAGESAGVAAKFLPSHRPVWYLPENRAPAAAWIAVFSRDTLKCILNQTSTRHLTCFHGVYPRPGVAADPARLVLFLNSSLGRTAARQAQRFYGDGLNKLEPRDVEAIPCPSLAPDAAHPTAALTAQLRRIENLPEGAQPAALDALADEVFRLTPPAVA